MAKSVKFKNDTYLDSTSIVHNKTELSTILDKNIISIADNPTVDIEVSNSTKILSENIVVNNGKLLIIGTVYIVHGGGTPKVDFLVDDKVITSFYASKVDCVYTFSTVANNLSNGTHKVSLQVTKGNAFNVKVPAYTSRNLTVIEI